MNRNLDNAAGIDEAFIERIVGEVVRRIQASQAAVASKPEPPSQQPQSSPPSIAPMHRMEGRLITMESLRAVDRAVTRLVVPGRAIVTPAVVDELRDRGVALIREGQKSTLPPQPLAVGKVDGADGPGWDAVRPYCQTPIEGDLRQVLRRLRTLVSGGGRALLVTSAPGVAVYTAFQHGLRAVYGSNARDIGTARRQIDPNVLVVDCHNSPNGSLETFVNEAS